MKTIAPENCERELNILNEEETCNMEIPIQMMLEEFMVFISKADFE